MSDRFGHAGRDVPSAPAGPRRILVIGSGGREHALAWRISGEPGVERVIVAPGNPGMRDVARTVPSVGASDAASIAALAEREEADLVVVGPEAPLVDGLADALEARGLAVFGPSAAASALEGSKAFCRSVAEAAGVAMADGAAYDDPDAALRAARALGGHVAIKADGLAAGKGVTVCDSLDEAEAAIRAVMVERVFGAAGGRVVVERAITGLEASVIAICDSTCALALPAARDHKRIFDGDRGPNTGGMGAYSPVADLGDDDVAQIVERFHRPVLAELARRGTPFRGALYAGVMLTADGPMLLEFNVRFGDPETQAILPRLDAPLGLLLAAAAGDRLAETARALGIGGTLVPAVPDATAAVVLAAPGYPGTPEVGGRVDGIAAAREKGALVFCAGVGAGQEGELVTSGGRVLSVVARGSDLESAAAAAYAGADRIAFPGRQLRRDIGRRPAAVATPAGPRRAEAVMPA